MASQPNPTARPHEPRQRNKRGEGVKLRKMIIDAAEALLEESGSERAVTIRAVTRKAGIAPQSFYLQFPSLSSLLFALYQRGFEALHARLISATDSVTDPKSQLWAASMAYVDFALENSGAYRTLMSSHGAQHPDWNPEKLPGTDTLTLLRDLLQAADKTIGQNPADLHIETTLLWTQLHGIAILMIDRPTFPWPPVRDLIRHTLHK